MRLILTYLILVGSCINSLIPECGALTGGSWYSGKIITDKIFEKTIINKGDTVDIRLEYYIHGFNEVNGTEECIKGESYELRPDFSVSVVDKNLISTIIYKDPNGEPRYDDDESEMKLRIVGLQSGTTSIWVEASFWYYGKDEDEKARKNYEISVKVQ